MNTDITQIDADEILIFTVGCIVTDRQYSPHPSRFAAGNIITAARLSRFVGVSVSRIVGLSRYRIYKCFICSSASISLLGLSDFICGKKVCLAVERKG